MDMQSNLVNFVTFSVSISFGSSFVHVLSCC